MKRIAVGVLILTVMLGLTAAGWWPLVARWFAGALACIGAVWLLMALCIGMTFLDRRVGRDDDER